MATSNVVKLETPPIIAQLALRRVGPGQDATIEGDEVKAHPALLANGDAVVLVSCIPEHAEDLEAIAKALADGDVPTRLIGASMVPDMGPGTAWYVVTDTTAQQAAPIRASNGEVLPFGRKSAKAKDEDGHGCD